MSLNKDRVIIGVDDQPENILMLEALIEGQGYTFFGCTSGLDCIALAQRANPKLILLDIQMPIMDGYETCRRLRITPAVRNVPIAFLTARKASEDVRAGIAAGGNDFIVKPFDAEKLLARVDYWTQRKA